MSWYCSLFYNNLKQILGVKINDDGTSEGLGQQYVSPEDAILNRGADIIIVGRGITHSPEPVEVAELYRKSGWNAYLKRVQQ